MLGQGGAHFNSYFLVLKQEPEPFEGELDEDDFIEGEFEDLEVAAGADDELDIDILEEDDDLEEDSQQTS